MDQLLNEIKKYQAMHPEFSRVMRLFNSSVEEYRKAVEAMGMRREIKITASSTAHTEACRPINR